MFYRSPTQLVAVSFTPGLLASIYTRVWITRYYRVLVTRSRKVKSYYNKIWCMTACIIGTQIVSIRLVDTWDDKKDAHTLKHHTQLLRATFDELQVELYHACTIGRGLYKAAHRLHIKTRIHPSPSKKKAESSRATWWRTKCSAHLLVQSHPMIKM